jgi:hypothetical protein
VDVTTEHEAAVLHLIRSTVMRPETCFRT